MEVKNQYIIQLLDNITNEHKEKALNNFVTNYKAGKIELPVSYEQYLKLKDIQSRIEALGLDKDEMWFLLLFAQDLVDRFIYYKRIQLGMRKDYMRILELLSKTEYDEKNDVIINDALVKIIIQCASFFDRIIDKENTLTLKENLISFCIYSLLQIKIPRATKRCPQGENTYDKSVLMSYVLSAFFGFPRREKDTIRCNFSKNRKDIGCLLSNFLNLSE
ncbi:MAG: hypothetical protein ACRCTZ_04430 [Sarcina sp.]